MKVNTSQAHKGPFINSVSMILAIFDPPPYSYVRFHLVLQHNKMLLEKDQLH